MCQSSNTGTFRFELIKQADLPKGLASLKGPLYEFADSFSLQGFSYMDYLNEVRRFKVADVMLFTQFRVNFFATKLLTYGLLL